MKVPGQRVVLEMVDNVVDDFLGEDTLHGGDVLECSGASRPDSGFRCPFSVSLFPAPISGTTTVWAAVVALAFGSGSFERKNIYTLAWSLLLTYRSVKAPPFVSWHVLVKSRANRERDIGHGTNSLQTVRLLLAAPWKNRHPMAVAK